MTFEGEVPSASKRSLFQLLGSLPGIIGDLVRAEFDAIKEEIKQKAIRAGVGAGLMAGAAFVLLLALIVFIIAAIAGLATVLPFWASALIIGGGLVLVAAILVFAGIAAFKSMDDSDPGRARRLESDLRAFSREGRREARAAGRAPGEAED
ncbi:MAG: phage holin family protein [Microbacteriaceae bacterium]|nr:phage holin family protein [Microbacteriaceae bacterium]